MHKIEIFNFRLELVYHDSVENHSPNKNSTRKKASIIKIYVAAIRNNEQFFNLKSISWIREN